MTNRVLWIAVGALGIACAAEGVALAERHRSTIVKPESRLDGRSDFSDLSAWQQRVLAQLRRDEKLQDRDFDQAFDDAFFRHAVDPFAEIDRVQQRMLSQLAGPERKAFDDSFAGWFGRRLALDDVKSEVTDGAKRVEVAFRIPGLDADTVKVDVNESRIRLSYAAAKSETKGKEKVDVAESFEKIVPLPADADPNGFDVAKKGESITLKFHKLGPHTAA